MPNKTIVLNREELEQLAKAPFDASDIEELIELSSIYSGRFREPIPDHLIKDSPITHDPGRAELEARRAFVEAVHGVWWNCYRKKGRGSSYRPIEGTHDGPLLRLLLKLFEAMGEPTAPSAATLHHDIEFIHRGSERSR